MKTYRVYCADGDLVNRTDHPSIEAAQDVVDKLDALPGVLKMCGPHEVKEYP